MPTIVLVGGSFLGAWAWERVTPLLTASGHQVHPLTLTGFGDRAHLGSPTTALATHARDITAAIEFAGLREVVLVAHSYGGAGHHRRQRDPRADRPGGLPRRAPARAGQEPVRHHSRACRRGDHGNRPGRADPRDERRDHRRRLR
ncbi:alpha/beta fold hydrolase [Microtetraspora fusca]|uniref:alpha/beta fold hydrolase n=1 Tax=Microtetraspora fusca TaxID=1997 RepID=UPI000B0D90AF